jgi:hypothetical protein
MVYSPSALVVAVLVVVMFRVASIWTPAMGALLPLSVTSHLQSCPLTDHTIAIEAMLHGR